MEKASILIRCTREEADLIRKAAALERRTLSGYIINAVMNRTHVRIAFPHLPVPAEKNNAQGGNGNGMGGHARRRPQKSA